MLALASTLAAAEVGGWLCCLGYAAAVGEWDGELEERTSWLLWASTNSSKKVRSSSWALLAASWLATASYFTALLPSLAATADGGCCLGLTVSKALPV